MYYCAINFPWATEEKFRPHVASLLSLHGMQLSCKRPRLGSRTVQLHYPFALPVFNSLPIGWIELPVSNKNVMTVVVHHLTVLENFTSSVTLTSPHFG